jgi:hypothetical protein
MGTPTLNGVAELQLAFVGAVTNRTVTSWTPALVAARLPSVTM